LKGRIQVFALLMLFLHQLYRGIRRSLLL